MNKPAAPPAAPASSPVVVAVANQKGGVGKTTATVNLAHALVAAGKAVLMVDADPQASLTIYAGQDPKTLDEQGRTLWHVMVEGKPIADALVQPQGETPQPMLLPASIRLASAEADLVREWNGATLLRDRLASLGGRFEIVLIDCSPSLGLLTVNALAAASLLLVPVKTDYLSLMGVSLLYETVERIRARLNPALEILGVLPTFYDQRNGHDREVLTELERETEGRMRLFPPVRRTTLFDRAAVAAVPTIVAEPEHKSLEGYHAVVQEILRRAAT